MNKKNFGLLLGSMREGAQILRGGMLPLAAVATSGNPVCVISRHQR